MSVSIIVVPSLLAARIPGQALATQWAHLYGLGKAIMPTVTIASVLSYAYLAYERSARGDAWTGFVAAAILSGSIVPYTLLFMMPTNNTLAGVANGSIKSLGDDSVRQTLLKWGGMNLFRSLLTLGGSVVGFWSLLV